jgi:8-oxo-dGTP pyrophosphatase MutT (NUDIX family)
MTRLDDYKSTLLGELRRHNAADAIEEQHLRQLVEFASACSSPFSRQNIDGHITVSAVLTDKLISNVLLIWHPRLQRWLQPGGHCEPDRDHTTQAGAFRELLEETSLGSDSLRLIQKEFFDVDVHLIPATENEKAHLHYDLRYLYAFNQDELSFEVPFLKWRRLDEVAASEEDCIARFARKLLLKRCSATDR